jgi:hypothetical protein
LPISGFINIGAAVENGLLIRPVRNGSLSQWVSCVKSASVVKFPFPEEKTAREGAAKDQAPHSAPRSSDLVYCCGGVQKYNPRDRHAPGRAVVFFASFLFGGLKRKEGGGRGAAPAVLMV